MSAHILIIDDEAPMRNMLSRCLKPMGCHSLEAETVGEALAVLRTQPVDLILLDLMLPDVDGYSFFELLREAHMEVPVIVISGCVSQEALDLAWELGAVDYVTKPFTPTELIFRVRKALASPAVRRRASVTR